MPPKPAAKGKDAAAAPPPAENILSPEEEVERRFLIEQCKAMKSQRIFEEAQLAQFHQEKERLNELWMSSKKDLEEVKAALRAKEREKDDLGDAQNVEIKVYKQRIKHLLFEHQSEATDARTDAQTALKLQQEKERESERELKIDRRDLKSVLREIEVAHEDYCKALKLDHDRNITDLRLEFERDTREMQSLYEDRMTRTREELNREREEEIKAIERRKSKHIAALVSTHEKAFGDIKGYYNEITHSNLDLIKTLKDEVDDLRSKEALHERSMFTIAQENKKMSEPMRKAIEEVKRLREERETYQKDLAELAEMKAHVLVVTDKLENLRWEHEILQQRYANLVQERDRLYDKFQTALHDVKQKSSFRSLLLERRLAAAASEVERQTVTLSEVLMAARLDPRVLGRLERQLADVVASKDGAIRELEGELERVAAAHDRLMDFFEGKLAEYGIPRAELGFKPLRSNEILRSTGLAAAAAAAAGAGQPSAAGAGAGSAPPTAGGVGSAGGSMMMVPPSMGSSLHASMIAPPGK